MLKVRRCKVRWSAENITILHFSLCLLHWHYLQHPGPDAMQAARPFCLSRGLRLIKHSAGILLQQDGAMRPLCVRACVYVCVSGQCLASSKSKLNLNESLSVLGYGNCRNRLHTVTRQQVSKLQQ